MMMKQITQRERIIRNIFGVKLAILLVIALFSYLAIVSLDETTITLSKTQETVARVEDLAGDAVGIDASVRGYVIVQDPIYLASYDRVISDIDEDIGALSAIVRNDPVQSDRLERLSNVISERIEIARSTIDLTKTDPNAAEEKVRGGEGYRISQQIEQIAAAMIEHERRIVASSDREASKISTQARVLTPLMIAIDIALLIYLQVTVMKHGYEDKDEKNRA